MRAFCMIVGLLLVAPVFAGDTDMTGLPLRVIHPRAEAVDDPRAHYPLNVLELALAASGDHYQLQPTTATMQQARALRLLRIGTDMDVLWTVASAARIKGLRMVPIAIDRGLIGWRVLLIRQHDARFAGIETVADLANLRGVQGHDWPDLGILRSNGLNVFSSTSYPGLFAMLANGRIDYFPRAVSEVLPEMQAHQTLPIEIEPRLLLHYPSGLHFFVNADNTALADALTRGLQRADADGRLLALFDATYGASLTALQLGQRHLIELQNPDTSAAKSPVPLGWRPLPAHP